LPRPAAFASCLHDILVEILKRHLDPASAIQRSVSGSAKIPKFLQPPAGSFNKGVSTRHLYRNGDFSKETARDSDRTKSQPEKEIPPHKATYRTR
jgi:hypothetical protein